MTKVKTVNEMITELKKYVNEYGDAPILMFGDEEGNQIYTAQFIGMEDGEVLLIPDERTNMA